MVYGLVPEDAFPGPLGAGKASRNSAELLRKRRMIDHGGAMGGWEQGWWRRLDPTPSVLKNDFGGGAATRVGPWDGPSFAKAMAGRPTLR